MPISLEYCRVDGFVSSPSSPGGNPAGVVLPPHSTNVTSLSSRLKVAALLNYAETVFVDAITYNSATNLTPPSVNIKLNYYTPTSQVDVCGHATVACLGLLSSLNLLHTCTHGFLELVPGTVDFYIDNGKCFMRQLPVIICDPLNNQIFNRIAKALNISFTDLSVNFRPRVATTGLRDVLVCIKPDKVLGIIGPDMEALTALTWELDVVGFHLFVLPKNVDEDIEIDVRNFAPAYGIPEEAATGTSNCALCTTLHKLGYLGERDGGINVTCNQGKGMGLPSKVQVILDSVDKGAFVGGMFSIVNGPTEIEIGEEVDDVL